MTEDQTPENITPTDQNQVYYLQSFPNEGDTKSETTVDESIEQPTQDPNVVITSDEGAE